MLTYTAPGDPRAHRPVPRRPAGPLTDDSAGHRRAVPCGGSPRAPPIIKLKTRLTRQWTPRPGNFCLPYTASARENTPYSRENGASARENEPYSRENESSARENKPSTRENETFARENKAFTRENDSSARENKASGGADGSSARLWKALEGRRKPAHPLRVVVRGVEKRETRNMKRETRDIFPVRHNAASAHPPRIGVPPKARRIGKAGNPARGPVPFGPIVGGAGRRTEGGMPSAAEYSPRPIGRETPSAGASSLIDVV